MELVKAVCLFSGGLDSILAVKILESQGVEVLAVQFVSPFFGSDYLKAPASLIQEVWDKWKIHLQVVDLTREYIPMLKNPPHGYGKNFNPCIDCKILMVRKAGEIMREMGADFVATGEVVGQRPMSQRRDTMRIVERESGIEGYLLRPLSAKLLPETHPEREGWVKRDRLFALSGRGRIPQMELARFFGIEDYPSPAGGCVLTDPLLSKRIEYVVKTQPVVEVEDIFLCHVGRHFVWEGDMHLVVARNQGENERLAALAREGDCFLKAVGFSGPTGLLRGLQKEWPRSRLRTAAGIVARYGKGRHETAVDVSVRRVGAEDVTILSVAPLWDIDGLGCKRL